MHSAVEGMSLMADDHLTRLWATTSQNSVGGSLRTIFQKNHEHASTEGLQTGGVSDAVVDIILACRFIRIIRS